MFYKTISDACTAEIIIKKSRFICLLTPLTKLPEFETELINANRKYPGANHYCFAYRIKQNGSVMERCSDDGEPGGTAGLPILNVLKQKELFNIMAMVVRYFGGTLLGTGGLVRAYTQSVQSALDAAQIISMVHSQKLVVTLDYNYYGNFEKQFFNIITQVINITYSERVKIELWIAVDKVADFTAKVENLTLGTALIDSRESGYVPQCQS